MHVLNDIPVGWWLGRAFGFVAYAALWASILSGLAMSGRGGGIFDPKWVYDVHQETTLMAVLAALGHAVVIVLDTASGVSRFAVLIPFASARLTGPGMSALYVGSASFVIGGMVWRVGVTALQSRPQ